MAKRIAPGDLEAIHILNLARAIPQGRSTPLPEVLDPGDTQSPYLVTSCAGLRTGDSLRMERGGVARVIRHMRETAKFFATHGFFIPNLVPRNLVFDPGDRTTLVDWEKPASPLVTDAATSRAGRDFVRNLALIEELSPLAKRPLALYSRDDWPSFRELYWSKGQALYCDVRFADEVKDARPASLGRILGLTDRVADHEYLRLITLFWLAGDVPDSNYSAIYAADLVFAPDEDQTARVMYTLLCAALRRTHHPALWNLKETLLLGVASVVGGRSIVDEVDSAVDRIGQTAIGPAWRQQLADEAQSYVLGDVGGWHYTTNPAQASIVRIPSGRWG